MILLIHSNSHREVIAGHKVIKGMSSAFHNLLSSCGKWEIRTLAQRFPRNMRKAEAGNQNLSTAFPVKHEKSGSEKPEP